MYRIRFLYTIVKCLLLPTQELMAEFRVAFFAWPLLDTDFSRLFTQTYTSYMGICRWHFVFNSKFRNVAIKNGWVPVTTAETITYKKSIRAFDRVTVVTRLLCWNERRFYLEHSFFVRGTLHAQCHVEGLIRSPKGVLKPPDVFRQLGATQDSPAMSPAIAQWCDYLANPVGNDRQA